MCFQLFYPVDNIDEPDFVEGFRTFDPMNGIPFNKDSYRRGIKTASTICLHNLVVTKAIEEAERFGNVVTLDANEPISEQPDRTVILCSMYEYYNIVKSKKIHPDVVFGINNAHLIDKTISLTLKDFGFLAMYSLSYIDDDKLEPGVTQHGVLRVKLGLEAEAATIYRRKEA